MSEEVPSSIENASRIARASLSQAREMVGSMFESANKSPDGFNAEILARMRDLDVALQVGFPADAQAIAEFLTYSDSPMQALFEAQTKATVAASVRGRQLCTLVVQAALAEQQNADHSLKDGRQRFDASMLEDWVFRGAHRPGMEKAPLTQMAKAIDVGMQGEASGLEARFGCVIPVVVSVRTWKLWQAQDLASERNDAQDDGELVNPTAADDVMPGYAA